MDWARAKKCIEQYTKDTETVARFLRDEGRKFACGEGWLKAPESDGKPTPYILVLKNFELIARHLATQSAFSVPSHIMDAIDRVIELRSECNRIHQNPGDEKTAANLDHEYPVQVFQNIRNILLLLKSSGPIGPSAVMQGLRNMKKPQGAREADSLVTVSITLSFFLEGLGRVGQAVQRCWSRRKAGVNDGHRV